ncbi:YadA family autotransporter adhesin [Burkholderia alba]|uniref:YadA family autotransporter adhesin n=1 Tax=Burkholderia alba TaxID=2683677 RepID=UPI002B0527F3|nr:YadA family autotransporter adhesin [Burkholderia alba]
MKYLTNFAAAAQPRSRRTLIAATVASATLVFSAHASAQYVAINSTGAAAQALGTDSVAIGPNAIVVPATDTNSMAIGSGANVAAMGATSSSGNIAFGTQATVGSAVNTTLDNAIAIGTSAQAERSNSIAIGTSSHSSGAGIALGTQASTGWDGQIAIGTNASASASAFTNGGIAIGQNANTGGNGIAAGYGATAAANQTVAIGPNAFAAYTTTAVGSGATATGENSVALGTGSSDGGRLSVVSVGNAGATRAISNVTAGTQTTDAANVGQLPATINGSVVTMGNALAPNGSSAPVTVTNVAAGAVSATSTDVVNGSQLNTTNQAVAGNTTAIQNNATSITNLINGTAGLVQQRGGAPGAGVITVGASTGGTVVDFTGTSGARQLKGVAAGVAATDAVNVGQLSQVSAAAANAVQYDDATKAHVTLGGPGAAAPVGLSNVAPGALGATSTDAVNGAQLFATNQSVSTLTTNVNNGTVGLVQQVGGAPGTGVITVGASTGGAAVDFTGTSGARQLKGVAAGVDPTDAVNVSQLQQVSATASNAVQYDNAARSSVTLGGLGATGPVLLNNVAPATLSATSTQAVNGAQLYATNLAVTANTNAISALTKNVGDIQTTINNQTSVQPLTLPKSVQFFAANSAGAPANASGAESVAAGGSAVASGTNSVAVGSGAQASGTGSTVIGANASAKGNNAVAIGQGSAAPNDNTVSIGNSATGMTRSLSNVSAGVAPTDAVNVGQLNDSISGVRSQIEHDRKDASGGTASAVAIASLPQAPAPGTSVVSVGGGTYAGQSAMAVGMSTYVGRWILKASGSTNTRGTVAGGLGAGYVW